MKTEGLHRRIDNYLSSLPTQSDKNTQFYDAAIIAKNALLEVDKLQKEAVLHVEALIMQKTLMKVNEMTMLVQQDDGKLYYKYGDEIQLASMTDICKHYKTMRYNLDITLGCFVTDVPDQIKALIGEDKFDELFWRMEYIQIPENCERIK